jgi:hypothetical protein
MCHLVSAFPLEAVVISVAAVLTVISGLYWLKTRRHRLKARHDWRINIDSDI